MRAAWLIAVALVACRDEPRREEPRAAPRPPTPGLWLSSSALARRSAMMPA